MAKNPKFSNAIFLFGLLGTVLTVSIVLKQPTDANGNPIPDPIILTEAPPNNGDPTTNVITLPITLPCIKVPLILFNQDGSPLYNYKNGDPIIGPLGKQLRDHNGILVYGPKGGEKLFGDFAIPKCNEPELPKEVKASQFGLFCGFFEKLSAMTKRLPVSKLPNDVYDYLNSFNYSPYDKNLYPSNEYRLRIEYWYNRLYRHRCADRDFWREGPIKYVTTWDISLNDELNAKSQSTVKSIFSLFSSGGSTSSHIDHSANPPQLQQCGLNSVKIKYVVQEVPPIGSTIFACHEEPSQEFVDLLDKIFPRLYKDIGFPVPGPKGGHLKDQYGRVVWGPRFCKKYDDPQLISNGLQFFVAQTNDDGKVQLFDPNGEFAPLPTPGKPAIIVGDANDYPFPE